MIKTAFEYVLALVGSPVPRTLEQGGALCSLAILVTALLVAGGSVPPDPDDFKDSFIAFMRSNYGTPTDVSCSRGTVGNLYIYCKGTVDGVELTAGFNWAPGLGEPDWEVNYLDDLIWQGEQEAAERSADQQAEAESFDTAIADAVVACEDWEDSGVDFQLFDDGHTVAFESDVRLTDDSNLECISEELDIPSQVLLEMEMLNEPEPGQPPLMLIYDDEVDD